MLKFIIKRFGDPMSWGAIFLLIGAFTGFELTEAQEQAITVFGLVMFGAPDEKVSVLISRVKLMLTPKRKK